MALARCAVCTPKGLRQSYTHAHTPVQDKSILCGSPSCTSYALIWLTDEEQQRYASGVRLFRVRTIESEVR